MGVDTTNPQYDKLAPKWKRCRDAAEGQDAVHEAGELYLPKLKDQEHDDYLAYKLRTGFFNATWRTIAGLQGMLFRKPPVIETPASVTELLDTVTADGQPFRIFTLEAVEECLTTGRAGVLVDYPVVTAEDGGIVTQADAAMQNLRPIMALYKAESIVNWREQKVNNRQVLTRLVLREECEEEDPEDEFESKSEVYYRVLDLFNGVYRLRMFEKTNGAVDGEQFEQEGEDVFPTMNGKTLDFIPFYFLGTDDARACPDEPPLIDLVDVNFSHYRTNADYEHGCHFTGLPTGWITGHTLEQGEKIYLGAQHMLVFPNPETKTGFLEFSGVGLACLEKNLARKEQQMAILGARMLEAQKKAAEATETAQIHRLGESSMLASMAQAISLSMEKALQVFSDWAGGNGPVRFELNRDFFPANMDSQRLTALVTSWQYGAISAETLFENLQQAEIISDGIDFETEQVRIANAAPTLAGSMDQTQQGV